MMIVLRLKTTFICIKRIAIGSFAFALFGCSHIKEYPESWPKLAVAEPNICPMLVGSYLSLPQVKKTIPDAHGKQDANVKNVNDTSYALKINIPEEGALKMEESINGKQVYIKQFSVNEKTLACDEKKATLTGISSLDAAGSQGSAGLPGAGGLVATKSKIILSKDSDGFLVKESIITNYFFFIAIPVFKYTENYWVRYSPVE